MTKTAKKYREVGERWNEVYDIHLFDGQHLQSSAGVIKVIKCNGPMDCFPGGRGTHEYEVELVDRYSWTMDKIHKTNLEVIKSKGTVSNRIRNQRDEDNKEVIPFTWAELQYLAKGNFRPDAVVKIAFGGLSIGRSFLNISEE